MIPSPHGGRLVTSYLGPQAVERLHSGLGDLPKLWPEAEQLQDAVQIGTGAYSPLDGFMDRETLDAVLLNSRLPSSVPWTMPVLLTPPGRRNRPAIEGARPGQEIALLDAHDRLVGRLHLCESYPLERTRIARAVYRTTDVHHPNVGALQRTGDTVLAGKVEVVAPSESVERPFELTPTDTRGIFYRRHWSSVAAFHSRALPHRAHEYLLRLALDRDEIDGVLVQPAVGSAGPEEYRASVILAAYESLIANYLPVNRIVLASLPIRMRFAGPRAALFLAIVRKNFGCSHYIVGRDQAGIDRYFDPYESQRIFDDLPIGVAPLRYPEMFLCRQCQSIVSSRSCPHSEADRVRMSQSQVRRALVAGSPGQLELLRPEVAALVHGELSVVAEPGSLSPDPPDRERFLRSAPIPDAHADPVAPVGAPPAAPSS